MSSKFTKQLKIIVVMLSLLITTPLYRASATNDLSEKHSIRSMFSNPSTALAVAKGYNNSIGRPYNYPLNVDEEITLEALGKIVEIEYDNTRPISFFDKDLEKLKGIKKLYIVTKDFNDLSGIEVLSDRLENITLNATSITDITPLENVNSLKYFSLINTLEVTNKAIASNPNFAKPLENLKLESIFLRSTVVNDHHAKSISKITSLVQLIVQGGRITDFEPLSNLVNLVYLDLVNNRLLNVTGFNKLVNLKTFTAETTGDNIRENNIINDFSDITFPFTSTGKQLEQLNLSNISTILPLTVEYVLTDNNEYEPVYYFELDRIKLPKSSPGSSEFELEVYTFSIVERVDLDQNRLYLNRDLLEDEIRYDDNGDLMNLDCEIAYYRPKLIEGPHFASNYLYLYVDTIELKGDLPPNKKVNVEFVYNNETPNTTIEIDLNEVLIEPKAPTYGNHTFVGWYTDSKFTSKWNFDNPVTEDMTLYARWEYEITVNYYDFKFDTNGGTNIKTLRVEENTKVDAPVDPIKDGYTFKGWFRDFNLTTVYDFDTLINNDTTIYAKWEKNPVFYNFMFDTMGGSPIETQIVKELTKAILPEAPTKEGYTFVGWYINKEFLKEHDFGSLVRDHVTVYAKWEPIPVDHTVKFDTQGGNDIKDQIVRENTAMVKPADPVRDGYTFKGWYKDLLDTDVFDFNTLVTEDLTLYAKWERVPVYYNFIFDTMGGSAITTQRIKEFTLPVVPEEPTRDGFTFVGWFESKEYLIEYDFRVLVNKDITVYAKWEPIPVDYTVKFDTQGGNDIKDQVVRENTTMVKPADPVKENFIFKGWYIDLLDTNEYNFETPVTKDLTLFAKWEMIPEPELEEKLVRFDSQGGSSIDDQIVPEYTVAQKPENPVRDGYVFLGWFLELTDTDTFDFNTIITEDLTLYAKWDLITESKTEVYVVSFDTQGGSLIADESVIENTLVNKPNDPIKEGYTFMGWFIDLNDDKSFNFETLINDDLTLIAKWEEDLNVFELSFDSRGGSYVPSQSVVENTLPYEPDAPRRSGHFFMGWYEDEECTVRHSFEEHIKHDKVVYAKWEENKNVLPSTGVSSQSETIAALAIILGLGFLRFNSKKREENQA